MTPGDGTMVSAGGAEGGAGADDLRDGGLGGDDARDGEPGDGDVLAGEPGDGGAGGDQAGSPGAADGPTGRRRSRTVLYTAIAVAVVVGVLVAVLASSKPVSQSLGASPLLGKPAPPVAGPGLSGTGYYSLNQFHGKWVLINFSASWCVPCRQETPQLLRFENEHARAGNAVILAVSFDPTDTANLAAFLKSSDATWPAVKDPGAEVAYGVSGIPESYLVAPGGTVVAKFLGGVTASQIDRIIQRASGA